MNNKGLQSSLANLGDSISYIHLERGSFVNANSSARNGANANANANAKAKTKGRRARRSMESSVMNTSKHNNSSSMRTATAQPNLVRDDFLIFELVLHSEDKDVINDKTTRRGSIIRDTSDYSIFYHNWTLRQLYKHVVSSVKVHSPATATPAAVAATGNDAFDFRSLQREKSIPFYPLDTNSNTNEANNASLRYPPPSNKSRRTSSSGRYHRRNTIIETSNGNPKLLGSNLHPRDMRRLITPFSASNEPELIVRRHVMVFNFDPLRAIITRDRLLILVPNGADSVLKNLEERIVGSGVEYDLFNEDDTTNSNNEHENDNQNEIKGAIAIETEGALLLETDDEDASTVTRESMTPSKLEKGEPGANHNDGDGDFDDEDNWSEIMMEMEMEGQKDLTFELVCVNACLSTVYDMLAVDTNELLDKGLKYVQDRIIGNGRGSGKKRQQLRPEDAMAVIRNLKNAVKVMQARVKGFVHSINRILNEDEAMALMNVSRLITHPEIFLQPISSEMLEIESDEPELVLESNLHNALTLSNMLDLIQGQVDTASDLIDARMDAARNKFLLASLLMSIASLSLTAMTCVGGIFGMNLNNGLETAPGAFAYVTYGSIFGSAVLGIVIFAGMVLTGIITGIGPVDQDGIDSLF